MFAKGSVIMLSYLVLARSALRTGNGGGEGHVRDHQEPRDRRRKELVNRLYGMIS